MDETATNNLNDERRIVTLGPSVGRHYDKDIPAFIVTAGGARSVFDRKAVEGADGLVDLSQLAKNECVIAPGLIYRDER